MSKKKSIIKWSLIVIVGLIVSIVSFGFWFMSLLPTPTVSKEEMLQTVKSELPYLSENIIPSRGKILAVVTSTSVMGATDKSTGFELTELSRTYYVFEANGYEVDVASPLGGQPPVVIDTDDMKEYDYAFLNDKVAQEKVSNSIALQDVNPADYEAVFFVGGKGAMFDFPENEDIQSLVRDYYESGKVIGAVCHGPAALVNVTLSNGQPLLANKAVSSFTNEEELFLIPDAEDIFPFLLQDELMAKGAHFSEGLLYLNKVSQDGNLVTGQNPWSTWEVAESIIKQLGHEPKEREITSEEYSIKILGTYESEGYDGAKNMITNYSGNDLPIDRELLAVHSILATVQLNLVKSTNLIRLLIYSNTFL
ncbi:MAG: putative intracellular protease/amidase [Bacteroidia bacterium]|jgi:putative intracellular protease/amidase